MEATPHDSHTRERPEVDVSLFLERHVPVSFSPYDLVPMSNTVSKKVGTFTAKFCCGTFTVFESTNEAA